MGNACCTDTSRPAQPLHAECDGQTDTARTSSMPPPPMAAPPSPSPSPPPPPPPPIADDEHALERGADTDSTQHPFAIAAHSLHRDARDDVKSSVNNNKDAGSISMSPTALSGTQHSGWSVSRPFGAVHGSLAAFSPLPPLPPTTEVDPVLQSVGAVGASTGQDDVPVAASISDWSGSWQQDELHQSLPVHRPPQHFPNANATDHNASSPTALSLSGRQESISDWSVTT